MNTPRTVAIIQARMGSSRLPGKVLADIAGEPMLVRVIDRVAAANSLDAVVVATTDAPIDDPIAQLCDAVSVACYRGSEQDVLDRINRAARASDADIVVRITADCPLIDGAEIDRCVRHLSGSRGGEDGWDFVTNRLPPPWTRTYPIGLDVECCWRTALERAAEEAERPHQREHVMPYIYENARIFEDREGVTSEAMITGTGAFRVLVLQLGEDLGSTRWTVDTVEDLHVVREIYAALAPATVFSWREALKAVLARPGLLQQNSTIVQRHVLEVDDGFGREE